MKVYKRRMIFGFFIALFVVLFLGVSTHLALAVDGKVYPGGMCYRVGGTFNYNVSAIGNPSSTSWLDIDCPCINDTGKGVANGRISMLDMSTGGDISCNFNSFYRGNNNWFGWWTPAVKSTGISSSPQVLTTAGVPGNSHTVYFFNCKIPPTSNGNISYINYYCANENE